MRYCLDTSAVDDLQKDDLVGPLTAGLRVVGEVWITAVNVLEASLCSEKSYREALLMRLRALSNGVAPLDSPARLLKKEARAHAAGDDELTVTVSDETIGLDAVVRDPNVLTEELRQEMWLEKKGIEKAFRAVHQESRPGLQGLAGNEEMEGFRTAASFLRSHIADEGFVGDVVNDLYEKVVGTRLPLDAVRPFLDDCPSWGLYLLGWGHASYSRAVSPKDYGVKNAGGFDLWSAAYLPWCDVFLTADLAQYRALRLINRWNPNKTRVRLWAHFRESLLVGQ